MYYSTKKFCEMTGMKINTLRYYIETGLLTPASVLPNGYRQFSLENIIDAYLIRNQRGIDASIEDLKGKRFSNIEDQKQYLSMHLKSLNEEKKHLELKIQRVEYFLSLLDYPIGADVSEIEGIDGGLYLLKLSAEQPSLKKVVENWTQYPELIFICFVVSYKDIMKGQKIKTSAGIGMRSSNAHAMNLLVDEPVVHHTMEKGLEYVGKTMNPFEIEYEEIRLFLEELERRIPDYDKNLLIRITTIAYENNQKVYYFTISAEFD